MSDDVSSEESFENIKGSISPYQWQDVREDLFLPQGRPHLPESIKKIPKSLMFNTEEEIKKTEDVGFRKYCNYDARRGNYKDINKLIRSNDFSDIWSYLKYVAINPKYKRKIGGEIKEKCAIDVFGPWLEHDHANRILMNKKGTAPEGWICPNNPTSTSPECMFTPIKSKKEKFIKWVKLLNRGRTDLAFSKSQIIPKSVHWKLQKSHNFKFALPESGDPDEVKKFVNKMNQYAGEILLEMRGKGRLKSAIRLEWGNIKSASKEGEDDDVKPLTFTIGQNIESVVIPISPSDAEEASYLVKNYTKDYKNKIMSVYTRDDEEVEILRKHKLKNRRKQLKENEQKHFEKQLKQLGEKIGNVVFEAANELQLCGKGKSVSYPVVKILPKALKRNASHFAFSVSECTQSSMAMRNILIRPLFNGWVNSKSLNEKLFKVDDIKKFIKEYTSPSHDNGVSVKVKSIEEKMLIADNAPLLISTDTGKAMTPNFTLSFDPKKYLFNQTYEETIIGTHDMKEKSDFHSCVMKNLGKYFKQSDDFKSEIIDDSRFRYTTIDGVKAYPVAVKTNIVNVKSKSGKQKRYIGLGIDWGVISDGFYGNHIGVIFNYTKDSGLEGLKKFVKNAFEAENYALKNCLKK